MKYIYINIGSSCIGTAVGLLSHSLIAGCLTTFGISFLMFAIKEKS